MMSVLFPHIPAVWIKINLTKQLSEEQRRKIQAEMRRKQHIVNCPAWKCVLYFGTWETIEPGGYPPFRRGNPPDERKEGVANDDYIF